jgi:phosphoribosylformylglycinamidine synthase subunit PurL
VSGNVSLYNESKATGGGSAILPTPAIGAVGLLKDWRKAVGIGFKDDGDRIYVVGQAQAEHLGQSSWLRTVHSSEAGAPPPVDLAAEQVTAAFVRDAIKEGLVIAAHDVSDGGLLVAVAEMCLAGNTGADVAAPWSTRERNSSDTAFWFGEDQGRYVISIYSNEAQSILEARASSLGIELYCIGLCGGDEGADRIEVQELWTIPLATLRAAHEGFFPALMGG